MKQRNKTAEQKKEGKNGAKENNLEVAKRMKKEGCDIELIMKVTKLSMEDIEKLANIDQKLR